MNDIVSATDPTADGMLCPVCKVGLLLSDRQGIEIDYCPQCRGVWLDRGELDKIIERNMTYGASSEGPTYSRSPEHAPESPWGGHDQRSGKHGQGGKHGGHRRRGFLGGLFD